MTKQSTQILKMCLAAVFIALGWLFPFITGQIQTVGNMMCPMHIPVFLAGFILGPWYGAFVGFVTPLTRALMFGMPPIFPTALAMAFELAAYGLFSGLFFRLFHEKTKYNDIANIYISLVISMILGRAVWGLVMAFCNISPNVEFGLKIFLTSGFVNAWPGILIQLIIIPPIITMLYRAKLLDKFMEFRPTKRQQRVEEETLDEINQYDLKDSNE